MRIALAQLNYHIGNFESNANRIKWAIDEAEAGQADLIVFAELAVSGYPPRDFLEFDDFINRCRGVVEEIACYKPHIGVLLGSPDYTFLKKGKPLMNMAHFLYEGKVYFSQAKTLLPNYDVFDEYRYFEPNNRFDILRFRGKKIALSICEDLWNLGDHPLYRINPLDEMIKSGPFDLILNIAASPFDYKQEQKRKWVLQSNAKKYQCPLVYVNHVGAQTELLFDGGSLLLDASGNLIEELPYFDEEVRIVDLGKLPKQPHLQMSVSPIEKIYRALVMGVRNYFMKLGFQKAILGLSGGIDSALTLTIAAEALGPRQLKAILMPSQFSSEHSITDAVKLAENLGVAYENIPIASVYEETNQLLKESFLGKEFDITEENIQARLRGLILMALSNKHGYILLNTSNKSEAAVGYGTLYGDMNGGLSVIGDLYKTQVFEMSRWINREKEIIPWNSIHKPPSAELRPDQADTDSLPDYEILDKVLYAYIEERKGPDEIIAMGFDHQLVARILKLVNTNEYKRYQTPPILRISPKSFGMGRRMPIVAKYLG